MSDNLNSTRCAHRERVTTDPVCGMQVSEDSQFRDEYGDRTFLFCSAGCLTRFQSDPEHYLKAEPKAASPAQGPSGPEPGALYTCPMHSEVRSAEPGACPKCGMALEAEPATVAARTEYTCPMHPEIIRNEPGNCPICGMALEARTVKAQEQDPELENMTHRFWGSLIFGSPVVLLEMAADLTPGLLQFIPMRVLQFMEFFLATPVILRAGQPLLLRGWDSLKRRSLNMFTLIAMGIGLAWLYSTVAAFFPGVFPAAMREDGTVPVYFEAAVVITALVLLGQVLE